MSLVIENARVIDPIQNLDAQRNIFIVSGKIVALGAQPPDGFVAKRTIDAKGLIACPGLIDLAARLREPGFEHRATLETEMEAAMAGGVTSLAVPPDTDPPLDEPGLVEMLCYRAKKLNRAHIYPIGALTLKLKGERLSEMAELAEAGCVAFSQANQPITNINVLMRAMQYAATFDYPVWLQPSDYYLSKSGVAHDALVASRFGLPGIPVQAETVALYTYLQLAKLTGARLHIARLSSASGLDLIRQARKEGVEVSCDVSINHLLLCDEDIGFFDTNCRLVPPLRGRVDRASLSAALKTGEIDAVCSDHSPLDDEDKQVPFSESVPGASSLELLLPLTLKWAQAENVDFSVALERITSAPARLIGIKKGGHLSLGARADICLFDPNGQTVVNRETLKSLGKNTPFLGQTLPGKVCYTLVEGKVMFE